MLGEFSDVLKVFLQIAQVVALIYAGYKFTRKPHDSLEQRVTELEVKQKETDLALKQGNDRFRHNRSTTEVLMICMLALIDFELAFCSQTNYSKTEDLLKAKNLLREHLAKKDE